MLLQVAGDVKGIWLIPVVIKGFSWLVRDLDLGNPVDPPWLNLDPVLIAPAKQIVAVLVGNDIEGINQILFEIVKAVNWLCINSGVRLIRILAPTDREYDNCICITRVDDSGEALSLAITEAFRLLGVEVSVNMKKCSFSY